MKISYEVWREMVSTPQGGVSSSRVLAWDTWVFTKRLIMIFLLIAVGLVFANEFTKMDLSATGISQLMQIMGGILLFLFTAIYAPKQFAKMSETKAILHMGNKETKELQK